MRRSPVFAASVVVALVAVALGVLAWRAEDTTAAPANVALDAAVAASAEPAPSSSIVAAAASTSVSPPEPLPTTTASGPEVSGPAVSGPAASATPPPTVSVVSASTTVASALDGPASSCPSTAHGAIVDRDRQQAWLCGDGAIVAAMPITSAWSMPDPGTYPVYAKDLDATSNFGGHFSRMTHFVAFTYGKRTGARIAFHSVPTLNDGSYVQPLDSVGEAGRRGESNGCIRVLPDDAVRIWDWLAVGDEVNVVS